ncbi:MAG TPA: AMP-binding protein [Methylibium sp.]|nr:AMP-binding protein [Methylibium sp.]
MSNLYALLDKTATRHPEHGAVYRGTEPVWRWRELRDRVLRLAGGLRERCHAGDRVALYSDNRVEYVEVLFAAWAAGLVVVPINAKLHGKEAAWIVEDASPAVVLCSAALAAGLQRAAPGVAERLVVLDQPAYGELAASAPIEAACVGPEALAWLFYTSGTTGRSKGAMLTHRNLLAMTIAHLADVESPDENAGQLHAAPMSHGSGLYMLPSVARAVRQVVPASGAFDPGEFLDLCDHHGACSAFLAPTMVQRLRLAVEAGHPRPRQPYTIVYGGGPMHAEELKKSMAVLGPVFAQIYGQGEAPMTITCVDRAAHARNDPAVLGSVGWPRSGVDVRVVGADGRPLPPGEVGEIVCRGEVVMAGYWGNPTATREALRDGWLRTGDMGSFDARGCLTLRDRSKDVVISGGSNVYPREVEEVLLGFPGVAQACVLGRPDAEWGETVVAFVVRVPGATATARELDAHCLAHIARFKRPKEYHFVDALPTSGYGKVLKSVLRRQLPYRG